MNVICCTGSTLYINLHNRGGVMKMTKVRKVTRKNLDSVTGNGFKPTMWAGGSTKVATSGKTSPAKLMSGVKRGKSGGCNCG